VICTAVGTPSTNLQNPVHFLNGSCQYIVCLLVIQLLGVIQLMDVSSYTALYFTWQIVNTYINLPLIQECL